MKRCKVCGNIGDDSSTKCEVCGNPFTDAADAVSEENSQKETSGSAQPREAAGGRTADAQRRPAQGARPRRKMKSGPHIYGQEDGGINAQEYARQGTVRKTVQGGSSTASDRTAEKRQGSYQQPRQGVRPQGQAVRQGNPSNIRPMRQGSPAPGQPVRQGGQMQGQPMRQGSPAPGMMNRPAAPVSGLPSRQVMTAARGMLSSPVFLGITVLYTVYFICSIAAIFLGQMNYSQVIRLIQGIDFPGQVSGYISTVTAILSMLDSGALLANLALHVPSLLFCIGLWAVYAAAHRAEGEMSGAGFVFLKAMVIINMIVACVVMTLALILMVAVVIASWISGTVPIIVISTIVLVLAMTVVMMIIMYYFCYLATIKTCRLNSTAGESYGRVSAYVAVIHIILALSAVVNLLSGIVNSEIANIVGSVGSIGWMVLFAVWIFMYRGKMEEYEE